MAAYFKIHNINPQKRLISIAVQVILKGGVIVYPTDSGYGLGCHLGNKEALERIRVIKRLNKKHNFTMICRDLSEISTYAIISTPVYRLLKYNTPGPYTFILKATKEVPKRLLHPKKKTIGIRIPDNKVVQSILEELNAPILNTTLIPPEMNIPVADPEKIMKIFKNQVDLILDGGNAETSLTTVIDLLTDIPVIVREGKGSLAPFI